MPLTRTETYSTTGTKGSWNLDTSIVPFQASVSVVLSDGGSASYKLQYSYDALDSPTAVDSDATWFDSTDIPAATAASAASVLSAPVARVRLVIASLTGTLKMTVIQPMSVN